MFLTADELAELTGYLQSSRQIVWLRAQGWVFEIGGDGKPKVLRDYARARMGVQGAVTGAEPDFSAIR